MRACPRRLSIVILTALLTLLAACGGGSSSSKTPSAATTTAGKPTSTGQQSAATTVAASTPTAGAGASSAQDPCALLTVAEIQAAVNMTVAAGKINGVKECTWPVGPLDESRTVTVSILAANLYPGLAPSTAVKVTGIGDDALWANGLLSLYVHAGSQVFAVQVVTLQPEAAVLAAAKTLAAQALARLQAR